MKSLISHNHSAFHKIGVKNLIILLAHFLCFGMTRAEDSFTYHISELLGISRSFILYGTPNSYVKLADSVVSESQSDANNDLLFFSGLFGKGWPAMSSPDPDRYIEFVIPGSVGSPFYISRVQLPIFRESRYPRYPDLTFVAGEEGPRKWVLRWSRDNFAQNLGGVFDLTANNDRSPQTFLVDLWSFAPTSDAVTFRLYGYDAPSSEGSGGLRVQQYKLSIIKGSRPPLFNIPPKITYFAVNGSSGRLVFLGGYGGTYGLEQSVDLQNWTISNIADVTIDSVQNTGVFDIAVSSVQKTAFYRVISR